MSSKEAAISRFLKRELGNEKKLVIENEADGYSNETLFARWGERELVIRSPPVDNASDTAHDIRREYRILQALQQSDVPVPPTVCLCEDRAIIGKEFYVMDRVAGTVIRRSEPEQFRDSRIRQKLAEEFISTLATIHQVDYKAVQLEDLGEPDGYIQRQIDTFQQRVERASEITSEEREVPDLIALGEWLDDNAPDTSNYSLVHGDYKLDNVMFGPDGTPEINNVFDWELSTLGDPLADLGYTVLLWPHEQNPHRDQIIADRFAPKFLSNEGYPSRSELIKQYEEKSKYEFQNKRFYLALAAFKIAALGESFFAKYLRGAVNQEMYRSMGESVPELAEQAWAIIDGEWTV
jgi:aminoglycoside phosphotransferase (APT) family kinase protein